MHHKKCSTFLSITFLGKLWKYLISIDLNVFTIVWKYDLSILFQHLEGPYFLVFPNRNNLEMYYWKYL